MDSLITDTLLEILMISITFSIILMAFIQKIKDLEFITKSYQTWFCNLLFSFLIGIPFAMNFYNLDISLAIWVSVFGFIGAPTLYETLKNQNLINYTPKSTVNGTMAIPVENEIKRD